jgi:hypothetical protein
MKSNKKAFTMNVKKQEEKKPKEYIESTPRFSLGDTVKYFLDNSTAIETGIVVGIFILPGSDVKNFGYQVEYDFIGGDKKAKKGLCMPRSENVIIARSASTSVKEMNSNEDAIIKFVERFKESIIKSLDAKIKDYQDSLVIADENIKKETDYKKSVGDILKNLEKRKKEVLKNTEEWERF